MLHNLTAVFKAGGLTLLAMLLCSILAVAVAIERAIHLWSFSDRMRTLGETVKRCLYRGARAEARAACERSKSPVAEILLVGFERLGRSTERNLGAAVDRERQRVALGLRGPLWILGTIGATTPFVGLFGTVVGIMSAFEAIGKTKQAGIEVVGPGIAEALISTAVGIGVAVVSLLFFNYFQARLARTNIELRLMVEEFVELLREHASGSDASPEPSHEHEHEEAADERSGAKPKSGSPRPAAKAKKEADGDDKEAE